MVERAKTAEMSFSIESTKHVLDRILKPQKPGPKEKINKMSLEFYF